MLKRLILIALLICLVYLVWINSITSNIIFSDRSLLSKGLAISKYLLVNVTRIVWWLLRELFHLLREAWHSLSGSVAPAYDIRSFQDLYHLYKQVEQWSGLPWQVFWGIHAEETNLGRNLGATQIISVLPKQQKSYFDQICRELRWDPTQIYGSHKGAIGPFQFIPETWVRHAIDANGDGRKDPFDVEDAAYSAANYLLHRGGLDDLRKALWHYNQDTRYVRRVLRYLQYS
ncbi:hypothetical protein GF339_00325 [candidate division KSB3 bacterium]|uniref:Transglycosylase SLT domain-containing protein n=1 Tax=candidate division KSB3 bacterium TaxID=2044937 RepID=A0A9D5Q3U0_9BACT|nr:hypothetical protein [candidate division KSB3 bacterium]MBD3322994.1 hypothetical protein [candidate division KSB3 bacterium]